MNHYTDWFILAVTLQFLNIYLVTVATTQAEERVSEDVKLKLYGLSPSDWGTSKKNAFAGIIANEATTYCTDSPSSCGLDSAATFTAAEVGSSSPEEDASSIEFTFYIDFPSGASVSVGGDTSFVVPNSAAQAIAAAARDDIEDDIGYYITYIDDEYYSIPPDSTTNRIIIPIAFVSVFLLAITTVSLHNYEKRKERQKQILQRRERKKTGNLSSSYNALDNTNTTILPPTTDTTPRYQFNNNNNTYDVNGRGGVKTKEGKVSKIKRNADNEPIALKTRTPLSNSVNEFHDGNVEGLEVVDTSAKKTTETFSVTENLKDKEARRERKLRKREKLREKERKRRERGEEEEEEERQRSGAMDVSYEIPAFDNYKFNSSNNLNDGSSFSPSVQVEY